MIIPLSTRIDHYEVVSLLGAGGMGEVYLAEDSRLDRQVAIKVTRDGQRFLSITWLEVPRAPINVVVNWLEEAPR